MDAVLLARQRGSCYICFSATADRSGLTSRSDHKKKKGENLTQEAPPWMFSQRNESLL